MVADIFFLTIRSLSGTFKNAFPSLTRIILRPPHERVVMIQRVIERFVLPEDGTTDGVCVKCYRHVESVIKLETQKENLKKQIIESWRKVHTLMLTPSDVSVALNAHSVSCSIFWEHEPFYNTLYHHHSFMWQSQFCLHQLFTINFNTFHCRFHKLPVSGECKKCYQQIWCLWLKISLPVKDCFQRSLKCFE
jgi:hypothetical protein